MNDADRLECANSLHIDKLILEVRQSKKGEAPRARDGRKGLPDIRLRAGGADLPPDVYAKGELARKKLCAEAERELEAWEIYDAMYELVLASDTSKAGNGPGSSYCVVVNNDGGAMSVET